MTIGIIGSISVGLISCFISFWLGFIIRGWFDE